ncbi:MAG TPA: serine/threonine-protein kinase, partial [Thermomicrobiaceae bacterium]|nr:serine/threonine-protein kinase [Thermomicrobiaceae bacterium]
EGSFSETYLATDTALGRRVAVKVLRASFAADARFVARFEREARAAAAVASPNVVDVYDYGRQDDTLYIVMEWVDGIDLKQLIRQRAPLPVPEAIALIGGILNGLQAIHRAGVVHRDIKPQNVLLTADGTPKLGDFGIARGPVDAGLTDTGMALGTAAYMAPEQATGAPPTPSADVYAAGVILFELLTGRLPFPGENPVQVMYQHVNTPPPNPRAFNPAIPPALGAVTLRALAKNPATRFGDAQQMQAAIDSLPSADAATAMLPKADPRTTPAEQTRAMRASAGAGNTAPPPPPPPYRRALQASGPAWLPILLAALLVVLVIGGVIFLASHNNGSPSTPTVPAVVVSPSATTTPAPTPTPTPKPSPTPTPVPPTPTPVPPTPTPVPPTPTPVPPTPTPVPPTPTPVPPTPTPQPTAKPQPTNPPGTPPPGTFAPADQFNGALANYPKEVQLPGTALQGAYPAGQGGIQNAPPGTVALFSQASGYGTGQVQFNLERSDAIPGVLLEITGMDDVDRDKVPIRIKLNGVTVWEGKSPFANGQWGSYAVILQDVSPIKDGTNTVTIENTGSRGNLGVAPWILIQEVTVRYRL